MKVDLDCFPCFIRQTVLALRQMPEKRSMYLDVINAVLSIIQKADTERPPAYTTTFIHRAIREKIQADPFKDIKRRYNEIALGLYPSLKDTVKNSNNSLWTASRLAIAGNIIDFGIFTSVDIERSVRQSLESDIAVDDFGRFIDDLGNTDEILYLLDNSGEIVFDRLFIEEILAAGKKVKAVVKGSDVLNDVTMEDAIQIGLTEICTVIDNGSDAIGTILEMTPASFQEEFNRATLIISKGQGNFETLINADKTIYFLFQSKCDVVSRELGLKPLSMLFKRS